MGESAIAIFPVAAGPFRRGEVAPAGMSPTFLDNAQEQLFERGGRMTVTLDLSAVLLDQFFEIAAQLVGRAVGDSIAQWVTRFNQDGLGAMVPRHGGGAPPVLYGPAERDRILTEFRRPPDRERDGTATWSLNTLQRALRRARDGLPNVGTYTIWAVLHDAGISWQRDRSWCDTGAAIRKRKRGEVEVHDPDASAKKA